MKILIGMASIAEDKGGPSEAVHNLAAALTHMGHEVTITATSEKKSISEDRTSGYRVIEFPLTLGIWEYSRTYGDWIKKNVSKYDFLLIHSVFRHHSYKYSKVAYSNSVNFALRTHGSLNQRDLENKKLLKWLYLKLVERTTLQRARFIWATAQDEAQQARIWTGVPVETIPLGVGRAFFKIDRNPNRNKILFLARIAKKKGLEHLIAAQKILLDRGLETRLSIAGDSSDGLTQKMKALAESMGVLQTTTFLGHISGAQKNEILSTAGVFVLPSLDENFGISVAEALAAGIPVVITEGVSHASKVRSYGAGLIVERSATQIADAVEKILKLDDVAYKVMSESGSRLVSDSYSWDNSARMLLDAIDKHWNAWAGKPKP